jgi:hypothetical protein
MTRFIAFAWLLLILASSSRAFAEPPSAATFENDNRASAKDLFAQAEQAYSDKDFAQALSFYKQAFEAWPLPGFQFNIGQCHRQMGQFAQAIAAFQLYLEQSPKAPNRKAVRALLKTCKRELARHPSPPAAEPRMEDAAAPQADTLASNGEAPATSSAEPSAETPASATPSPAPQLVTTPKRPASDAARPLSPTWFWVATAGTGIFAGAAVVTGMMALSRNHEFKDPATSDGQRQDAKRTGQALQTATNVSLVCSGVSAVTAVILWRLSYGQQAPDLSVAWVPGGVLLTQQGRF